MTESRSSGSSQNAPGQINSLVWFRMPRISIGASLGRDSKALKITKGTCWGPSGTSMKAKSSPEGSITAVGGGPFGGERGAAGGGVAVDVASGTPKGETCCATAVGRLNRSPDRMRKTPASARMQKQPRIAIPSKQDNENRNTLSAERSKIMSLRSYLYFFPANRSVTRLQLIVGAAGGIFLSRSLLNAYAVSSNTTDTGESGFFKRKGSPKLIARLTSPAS